MAVLPEVPAKLFDQARLSNPRLAQDEEDLTLALAGPCPTAERQPHLFLTTHERREGTMRSVAHRCWLDHSIEVNWIFEAFERLRAAILHHEQT